VKLSSIKDKDTVVSPVKVYTRECGYRGCAFQTGDHMPSAKEYHKWLLENHFGKEHTVPPLEMLEGAVDRDSWNTFVEWWRHYTAIMMYPGEDHRRSVLQMRLGAVGTALCDKLGAEYFKLSELELLLEVMKITRDAHEELPKQEQLIEVDEVPFKEKEKKIGAENRFKAEERTFNKQEVTIDAGNVVMATRVPGGVMLKVVKKNLKVLKSDLKSDPKPVPVSDIEKQDLKLDLKSDLRRYETVEVAVESGSCPRSGRNLWGGSTSRGSLWGRSSIRGSLQRSLSRTSSGGWWRKPVMMCRWLWASRRR
jgi:hypothetical protein